MTALLHTPALSLWMLYKRLGTVIQVPQCRLLQLPTIYFNAI
jgi:uncharacterized protein with PQ loop repeat